MIYQNAEMEQSKKQNKTKNKKTNIKKQFMFCFVVSEWVSERVSVTNPGKTIDPTGNRIPSEPNTSIIAEMVTVLRYEVISIPSILSSKLFHHTFHLTGTHIRFPNQYRFPESEPFTPLRFTFKYPRRRVFMCPKRILNTMNWKKKIKYFFELKKNQRYPSSFFIL